MLERNIINVKKQIEALDNIRFEQLCYVVLAHLTGIPLHHRGQTLTGEPVKGTVDSYSDGGRIVGEYSIVKTYFSNLSKAEGDILHAKSTFSGIKQLHLFAGVEATPSQAKNMTDKCREYEDRFHFDIQWHDSREIAQILVGEIRYKNILLNRIFEIVPSLREAFAGISLDNHMLELPDNYCFPEKIRNDLLSKLKSNHFLYLHGISGIGKTMLSVCLQKMLLECEQIHKAEFFHISQVSGLSELRCLKDPAFGYGIDLISTIQSEQALFVLDDLCSDIDNIVAEVKAAAGTDSYVIITSQLACRSLQDQEATYELQCLDFESAMHVFDCGFRGDHGTGEQRELLYRKTAGYPILLNTIRSLMQEDGLGWAELEEELAHMPDYEVESGKNLTIKLLKRHQGILTPEFQAIQWLNAKHLSKPLLRKLISREGIRKLRDRSFLQELPNIYKIHDIVFECIQSLDYGDVRFHKMDSTCQEIFYQMLAEGLARKDADYFRMLHLHEDKIDSIARECTLLGREIYFYLQAYPNDEKGIMEKFNEERINLTIQDGPHPYVYKSIMECYEFRLRKLNKREEGYRGQAAIYIRNLDVMLEQTGKNDPLYSDLLHHQGKIYHNIQLDGEAMECFEEVLSRNPSAYESKLQIARIYDKKAQKQERIQIYREILDAYLHGESISMSVVLAAYEDIAFYLDTETELKETYFVQHYKELKEALISLSGTTFDQPYLVLTNVSKFYVYDHPELLKELLEQLHLPSREMVKKKNYFSIAQMYKGFGKSLLYSQTDRNDAVSRFKAAEYFYENMDENSFQKEYWATQRTENLYLLGEYEKALDFLDRHPFEDNAFWHYWRCGALLLSGRYAEALENSEQAISLEKQNFQSKFMATFYRKRAQAAFCCQEPPETIHDFYGKALDTCNNEKFKKQLKAELRTYKSKGRLVID